ncbi:ABC transporter ATP-binding protein [Streptomyces sp. 6N223]|uniref:ABC transporter ATP-binding protein n=1 Tax=Streptomyces sp. 6N223 TaxID=3457412 RepID=UPI003FCF7162
MHQTEDPSPLLRLRNLKTHFTTHEGTVRAVDGVDLDLPRGRTVAVVGESGCGKSITARSVLRLIDPPGEIVDGQALWHGGGRQAPVDLMSLDPAGKELRAVRGGEISMVFQEPMASLSPMHTIGAHLVESITLHTDMSRNEAWEAGIDALRRVGVPQPESRMNAYSFQLSGGLCQRAMIAIALACRPELLIADEPTTALDVTTQAHILDLLGDLQEQTGMSMLFITHDLGVVAEIADEVAVMYLGTVVEHGPVDRIFHHPQHPYTQALLRSVPRLGQQRRLRLDAISGAVPAPTNRPAGCPFHTRCELAVPGVCDQDAPPVVAIRDDHHVRCVLPDRPATPRPVPDPPAAPLIPSAPRAPGPPRAPGEGTLVRVSGVTMHYAARRTLLTRAGRPVRAVDGVDLAIRPGETLGLVGESGCGKSTLGRIIAGAQRPTTGSVTYTRADGTDVDVAALGNRALRPLRRDIRVVFQDPYSSLNPRMTLLQLVGEPLLVNKLAKGSELEDRVADMLRRVGLRPEYMHRYPHAFSGGQRQRVNIARALITRPRLVIADEAVSALDLSVRSQILNLLRDLQDEFGLTYLFISHDLSVVEHLCDRVAVMYLGRIIEQATVDEIYRNPRHPYTEALLSAVPDPDPRHSHADRVRVPDHLPDPASPPPGCRFHTRCPYAQPRCSQDDPRLTPADGDSGTHRDACLLSDTLTLTGVTPDPAHLGPPPHDDHSLELP